MSIEVTISFGDNYLVKGMGPHVPDLTGKKVLIQFENGVQIEGVSMGVQAEMLTLPVPKWFYAAHEAKAITEYEGNWLPKGKPSASGISGNETLAILNEAIPGFGQMRAKHPLTQETHDLGEIVVDLNDKCGLSREQIADWLETLDLDLTIKPPKKKKLTSQQIEQIEQIMVDELKKNKEKEL